MENLEIILNALGERIKQLEAAVFVRDLEINELKRQLAELEAKENE